ISRSVYIKECSVLLEVREQTLMNELNKLLRQKYRNKNTPFADAPIPEIIDTAPKQIEINPLDVSFLENDLSRLLMQFGNVEMNVNDEDGNQHKILISDFIIDDLENDGLTPDDNFFRLIINEFKESKKNKTVLTTSNFTNNPNTELSAKSIELLATPYELSKNWGKNKIFVKKEEDDLFNLALSSLMSYKSRLISKKLKNITEQMRNNPDDAEIFLLQQEFFELKKLANLIDGELNRPFNY
ncbi:MAG: hypothetical protein HOG83_03695, partial [Lentimicrobiaceae bacterium]|nr:hypothetical protein [Lentimicrobiaceae bacterium]